MKALCLRCDRCRSVCHTGVIGVGGFAEGLLVMRTPVMNFHGGFCDYCRKCAEVCPTGAIRAFDPETEKIGLAHVTETCIALRTAACTACEEACPYDAITLDAQNRPVVDPGLCNGCGKCEQVCPSASLRAYDASVEDKGIVVVSRSSEAAQATGAVSSEELASKRTVAVAQANAASPHTKGVHPDGPDATREAGA